ncbi:hypothetical protein CS022_19210 [Veronia nyctiphanis]|uniref:Uncharacterized protein n=1 Tax=Veronia nyctiphanis TaxID=1278244 RepID=A0A4Q0YM31_9GAMM|nr:hypothetical protein [Veronia nyctiphanis]RXJ71887.1 hypothetical protein CS022_19210 [Veronia nyctiphanis]
MKLEDRINQLMHVITLSAGYVLLVQAFVTGAEIVARKVFNHSFQGIDELGRYALAFAASVGFSPAFIFFIFTADGQPPRKQRQWVLYHHLG